jgi:hypothetical protein
MGISDHIDKCTHSDDTSSVCPRNHLPISSCSLDLRELLSTVVGDHEAWAAHPLGLMCKEVTSLEIRVIGHNKA